MEEIRWKTIKAEVAKLWRIEQRKHISLLQHLGNENTSKPTNNSNSPAPAKAAASCLGAAAKAANPNLDANKRLKKEEYERHVKEGLCLYCGGHKKDTPSPNKTGPNLYGSHNKESVRAVRIEDDEIALLAKN